MPVVDVSVIKAFNVVGYPIKKSFCVYVRLQGQAMRTNTRSGKHDEVTFNERFRFQYRPERKGREKNQLFVELWCKSMLSQSCVSVAWVDMDQQSFSQGVPVTFNMHGGFENKQATVTVVIVPVDFGTVQQPQVQAQPYAQGSPYNPQSDPYYADGQPAVGVPLQTTAPYPTGQYMQQQPQQQQQQQHYKTDPLTGQPIPVDSGNTGSCGAGCEAAPLPPAAAFANSTQPPPLYGGNNNNNNYTPPPYEPPTKQL